MSRRSLQLLLASLLGCALLAPAPSAAAGPRRPKPSSSGCVSAICVYQELQPTPSGGRPVGLGTSKPLPLSPSAGRALNRAGSAKEPLKTLVTSPAYSIGPVLPSHARGAAARRSGHPTYLGGSGPHALGMFDLGTGGTALLVLLAVSSGLLAVAAAVRLIRR